MTCVAKQQHVEKSGPMAGHVRRGRLFVPSEGRTLGHPGGNRAAGRAPLRGVETPASRYPDPRVWCTLVRNLRIGSLHG